MANDENEAFHATHLKNLDFKRPSGSWRPSGARNCSVALRAGGLGGSAPQNIRTSDDARRPIGLESVSDNNCTCCPYLSQAADLRSKPPQTPPHREVNGSTRLGLLRRFLCPSVTPAIVASTIGRAMHSVFTRPSGGVGAPRARIGRCTVSRLKLPRHLHHPLRCEISSCEHAGSQIGHRVRYVVTSVSTFHTRRTTRAPHRANR